MRLFQLGRWDSQLYLWGEASERKAQVEASDSAMLPRAYHDRDMPAPGRLLGDDLAYWAHVVRHTSALRARE